MKNAHRRPGRPALVLALLFAALSPQSRAEYAAPELKAIPLSRLLANIQARIEKSPSDPELHHHLARAYAMAYVKDIGADAPVQLNARGRPDQIWFGFEPPHVPYAPGSRYDPPAKGTPEKAPRKSETALGHLEKAIAAYEKALSLEPKNAQIIRLGLGWCRKEAGDKDKAIAELRLVIEEAWKEDGKAEFGGLRNFVSAEAIGYLIPLLDPSKQADEIAELKARKKKLEGLPRPITPIAVPLREGIGVAQMIDREARVAFDLDASGDATREWHWLRPEAAAWLVHDPAGEGQIRSAIQMFGNRSFHMFFAHGYAPLALLDDDGDGILRGPELDGLALWHDHDADGVSSSAEVRPLGEWGIVGLRSASQLGADGVRFSPAGVLFDDGTARPSFDLILESTATVANP